MKTATSLPSINPENGEILGNYSKPSPSKIEEKIAAADQAYRDGLRTPHLEKVQIRSRVLEEMATRLEKGADEYARIIALEMGKTLKDAKTEVMKCALCCRYYAEHGPALLAPENPPEALPSELKSRAEILYEPLGTVLAVMPWNFPFWQLFRCAAPILLSGNSLLLKHASNVPQCALAIEKIIRDSLKAAGESPEVFSVLLIPASSVSEIIADFRIRGVTLTGSSAAGREVAAQAGKFLKKTVLELGGSDPFILFPSANLEKALEVAVQARLLSNGQSCIAAKRFLIHSSLYARFRVGFLERFESLRMGSPFEPAVNLGPLATPKIREDLHALVEDALAKGAILLCGGKIPSGKGNFYPATVLESIPPKANLYEEEAFGPVASLYSFESREEAVEIANATPYGLGASIWTEDEADIEACARRIQTGQLFVNALVSSNPRLPFGGVKDSGYGRELGAYGVREWTNVKTLFEQDPIPDGSTHDRVPSASARTE